MNGRYSKRKAISFLNSFDDNILIPVQLECLDEIGVSDFTKLKSSKSGLFEDFYNEYMKKKNESSFGV